MITIRDIICLVNHYNLQKATFVAGESGKASIEIRNGTAYFKQLSAESQPLALLSSEEIDQIDDENSYYLQEVYNEIIKMVNTGEVVIPTSVEDKLSTLGEKACDIQREDNRIAKEMFDTVKPYLTTISNCNRILQLVNHPSVKISIRQVKRSLAENIVENLKGNK